MRAIRSEVLEQVADSSQLERAIAARATLRRVRLLSDDLPKPLREVVILAWFDGQDYNEIASRMRIPKATVKTRVMRARAQIAKALT